MKFLLILLLLTSQFSCGEEESSSNNSETSDVFGNKDAKDENNSDSSSANKPDGTNSSDYKYSAWSELSECSASCGIGTQTRTRSCRNNDSVEVSCTFCGGICIEQENCESQKSCDGADKNTEDKNTETKDDENNQSENKDDKTSKEFSCDKPVEGTRCNGSAIAHGEKNSLYTEVKTWEECLNVCAGIKDLGCCVWIERNMGFCGGTKSTKTDDFAGSTKIYAANCVKKDKVSEPLAPGQCADQVMTFEIPADKMKSGAGSSAGAGRCVGTVYFNGKNEGSTSPASGCGSAHCGTLVYGDGSQKGKYCTVKAKCENGKATVSSYSW